VGKVESVYFGAFGAKVGAERGVKKEAFIEELGIKPRKRTFNEKGGAVSD